MDMPPDDATDLIREGLGYLDQGVTIFDADLKLIAWNDQFLEMYGYPADLAHRGADFASFIAYNAERGEYGPGDPQGHIEKRVEIARRFERHQFERVRPDGSVIRIVGTPLPSGGFVATYTDVTGIRRQQAELQSLVEQRTRALRLSEERLRLVADEVPAGIAHIDTQMNFLYVNKRFARAYQRTPEEVIGLNASDVLHERTLRESSRFFEQCRRGAQVDFEMKVELPGNRFKIIRTLLRPENPSSGEITSFYFVSFDVTRRKATMSALMRAQKMDALGRMASGISHDFNNLLTIVLGNLVAMAEQLGEDDVLVEEYLTPSISAARRGSALTRRLLTIARREQYDPSPTDIGTAVDDICNLLQSTIPSSLELAYQPSGGLPCANVDRAQLEMALLNLALNARDATGGEGTITVETLPYDLPVEEAELLRLPAGRYLKIRFADDGCGMSPEQADRVFEPFFTSKAAGSGSGLGLSMVYGFVQQSNGAIWVDSEPGGGAVFTILLPSVDVAPPITDTVDEPDEDPAAPDEGIEDRQGIVLLVEDDQDVRRTIRRKIAGLGYPLVEAANADEALNLLGRIEDIRMVLSDIDMPGQMNGNGLATRISTAFPRIGVVLMSGQPQHIRPQGRSRRVPFLQKPFSAEDLAKAFRHAGQGGVEGGRG